MKRKFDLFRFHTGSIKSEQFRRCIETLWEKFRFHTGSIKSEFTKKSPRKFKRFDSILVRLKAVP